MKTFEKTKIFNELYDVYWAQLYRYSYNILRDKTEAEDVVQEVFIALWDKTLTQVSILNYKAYLYKAVKFKCIDKLKKIDFNAVQIDAIAFSLHDLEEESETILISNEKLTEKLENSASDLLPPKCFKVFWLRYKENMSYKEISETLNISINTVDNHLSKAIKILRSANLHNAEIILLLLSSFL